MTQKICWLSILCVGMSLSCGRPIGAELSADGGDELMAGSCQSTVDCPLGQSCVQGQCTVPPAEDSGFVCTRDEDCAMGLQCVKSTGQCVAEKPFDASIPDAGPPPECDVGTELSCGVSKLGECRLGLTRCALKNARYEFGDCEGFVGPVPEICDGKDNDCDGLNDEDLPELKCGVGACARTVPSCVDGATASCVPGDPGVEVCDGVDNDCDGQVDENMGPSTCGVGVCARSVASCQLGQPQACLPGAVTAEQCNGQDDDCDGVVDENLGTLRCGVGACRREVPACNNGIQGLCTAGMPGTEVCNGLDDDCDGAVDENLGTLSCGVGACARTTDRCIGATLQVCTPGVPSAEICNGIDDDCDGRIDQDTGTLSCGVGACAAVAPACVNGAPGSCTLGMPGVEVCNGLDDDCDGQTDEALPALTCGLGICQRTVPACVGGAPQLCVPGVAQAEACDGVDNDCDGQIDEGCNCTDGTMRSCYGGPSGTQGVGRCAAGMQVCALGNWGACTNQVLPATEICNGVDDDCDGSSDEGLGSVSCGVGVCARTVASCSNGAPQTCVAGTPGTEVCNGLDDDCDGSVDDNLGTLSCGVGLCARTVSACVNAAPQTCSPGNPVAELCDGLDNDCDGSVDEGFGMVSCGVGACANTVASCTSGVPQTCMPRTGSLEVCNGIDDDCNGSTDEGFGSVSCGLGVCRRTVNECVSGVPQACVAGTPGVETCNSLDDDCDGVVDDGVCGPTVSCPVSRTVNPNSTITLNTTASSPIGRPVSCQWSVVNRPATSNGMFSNPTSCSSTTYFADVVGAHQLRITTTDSAGLTSSCDVTITVVPLGDLWVELTWNRNNDMDLHLLHSAAGNNHTAGAYNGSLDCHWQNKTPSWDATGTADDPSLDRDDITGKGPENTRINVPSTAHPYTIAVHMYDWTAANAVTATVKLYCGGQLVTTQTRTFSTIKQMWVVGKVDFANPGAQRCTFTLDNFTLQVP